VLYAYSKGNGRFSHGKRRQIHQPTTTSDDQKKMTNSKGKIIINPIRQATTAKKKKNLTSSTILPQISAKKSHKSNVPTTNLTAKNTTDTSQYIVNIDNQLKYSTKSSPSSLKAFKFNFFLKISLIENYKFSLVS
jgi:hypothetical protein